MLARDYTVGKQFYHRITREVWQVEEVNGEILFVNQTTGRSVSELDRTQVGYLGFAG